MHLFTSFFVTDFVRKILHWNCRGLKANFNELLILLSLFNPKICCLQETFLTPNDNLEVGNYSSYQYINTDCQRASGGASIMIHSTVPHCKIDLNTNLQAIAIKASLNKSITICSIYIPPNKRMSQNDLENVVISMDIANYGVVQVPMLEVEY